MQVAIAGAHGKVAMALIGRLAERGDHAVGLIRNPDQAEDVRSQGAEPQICDLERASAEDIAPLIAGSDAAVFAAGAGPGSGAERKITMDRDGAIKLLDAAGAAGVGRYLIVSSTGAEAAPSGNDVFSVYLRAKAEADAAVQRSDREWTIVRPGRLTDDPGTGRVKLDSQPFRGAIAREDVAAVLEALLREPRAARHVFYLNGGEDEIPKALEAALA